MKANNGKMITKSHAYTSSNKDKNISTVSSSPSLRKPFDNSRLENVLILQGGGSLGAFGCGVFKALANNNIKLDIVAGTSIGGINAAIIAGSKNEKHPEQALEQFWLELSQGFVDLDKVTLSSSSSLPKFLEEMLLPFSYYYYNLPIY
jgi:NTE family protein